MHAKITAMHVFVRARAAEQIVTPRFWESLGYALGAATECIRHKDIVGAVRMLERSATRPNAGGPDYPDEAAR
ncbi:hypothetical protein ACFYRD_37190 [Streptomyces hirsutus]|uniref:hypothetical protein n=1 Tax=Streptomyces hirsutus TaxID=35620 RepID=UPI003689EBA1